MADLLACPAGTTTTLVLSPREGACIDTGPLFSMLWPSPLVASGAALATACYFLVVVLLLSLLW